MKLQAEAAAERGFQKLQLKKVGLSGCNPPARRFDRQGAATPVPSREYSSTCADQRLLAQHKSLPEG